MRKNKLLLLSLMAILLACGCDNVNTSSGEVNSTPQDSSTTETPSLEDSSTTGDSVSADNSEQIEYEPSELYVSPDAKNFDAKGTKDDPMIIQYAIRNSKPNSTIYLLDGIYKWGDTIMLSDATEDYLATCKEQGKTLRPLNKGKVKIDFSSMAWASANRGIQVNSDYWTIRDLEVMGSGDNEFTLVETITS